MATNSAPERRDPSPPGSGRKLLPDDEPTEPFPMAEPGERRRQSAEKGYGAGPHVSTRAVVAALDGEQTGYVPRYMAGPKFLTHADKLGPFVLAILVAAPLSQLCVVSFLFFLWARPVGNGAWNALIRNEWATRSVTIASFVIRIGVDLLTGAAASMLAALSLESGSITMSNLAAVSIMRSAKPSLWSLPTNLFQSGPLSVRRWYFVISILLAALTLALQFASTILLSDIRIDSLPVVTQSVDYAYDLDPGFNTSDVLATVEGRPIYATARKMLDRQDDLIEHLKIPFWGGSPSSFPIFGEYHEDTPPAPPAVDDTGYLIRSFLPFTAADAREAISAFDGPAFHLDARVSCQPPAVTDAALEVYNETVVQRNFMTGYFSGNATGQLDVPGLWFPPGVSRTVPFNCSILIDFVVPGEKPKRRLSICQHQPVDAFQTRMLLRDDADPNKTVRMGTEAGGSLRSRLTNLTVDDVLPNQSPTFLLVATGESVPDTGSQRAPWASFSLSPTVHERDPNATFPAPTSQEMLISLCYTSWRGNNGMVRLRTEEQLREPKSRFRTDGGAGVLFDAVLSQYYAKGSGSPGAQTAEQQQQPPRKDESASGQPFASGMKRPGVISMANFSADANAALAYPLQQSTFVQLIASVGGESLIDFTTNGFSQVVTDLPSPIANVTEALSAPNTGATFYDWAPYYAFYAGVAQDHYIPQDMPGQQYLIWADSSVNDFIVQALTAYGGSPAWTLSAALTLLSSMAYYDHFQMYDVNTSSPSFPGRVTRFTSVLAPQSWAGLAVVSALVAAEFAVVAAIALLFLARTRYSQLGNAWQAVAQVSGPETEELLRRGTLVTDAEVERWLGRRQREPVRIAVLLEEEEDGEEGVVHVGGGGAQGKVEGRVGSEARDAVRGKGGGRERDGSAGSGDTIVVTSEEASGGGLHRGRTIGADGGRRRPPPPPLRRDAQGLMRYGSVRAATMREEAGSMGPVLVEQQRRQTEPGAGDKDGLKRRFLLGRPRTRTGETKKDGDADMV